MKSEGALILAFLFALIPSAWLAWSGRDMPQWGGQADDGVYWICAKSLADGTGYRILNLPGQPFQTKYPPLYPLVLSGIWRIAPNFPNNLKLATCFSWLLFPIFLLTARRTFAELGLSRTHGWLLCIFLALDAPIILFSLDVMTELMFTSLLLAGLCLAERAARPGSNNRDAALAGFFGGAAYLTRVAAAPLLLSVPACLLYRRKRRGALLFLATMLPAVAGWSLWVRLHQPHTTDLLTLYHTSYFGFQLFNLSRVGLLTVIGTNSAGILAGISGLITVNTTRSALITVISLPLAILSITGSFRLLVRAAALQHLLYTSAFLAALMLWHFPPEERYVIPIFPILLAGLSEELKHIGSLAARSFRDQRFAARLPAVVMIVVLSALGLQAAWLMYRAVFGYLPQFISSQRQLLAENRKAYRWIAENVPRDSALLADRDAAVYLYTGHLAARLVAPPFLYYERGRAMLLRQYAALAGFLREHKLSYALLNPVDLYLPDVPEKSLAVRRRVFNNSSDFEFVYGAGQVSIYRLRDSREASP